MSQAAHEVAAAQYVAPAAPHGPRDANGHEWGVQIAVFLTPDDAARLAADATYDPPAAGVRGVLGPGCYRCKMVWSECQERACPGDRPAEIDRMRSTGESYLWGLDRKTRRLTRHRDRKAALRRGEDPDRPVARDPRDVERDQVRDAAERDAKARQRARNQTRQLERDLAILQRKHVRLTSRAAEAGLAGERGRRELAAFDRRYGTLPDATSIEQTLGWVAGLVGGRT